MLSRRMASAPLARASSSSRALRTSTCTRWPGLRCSSARLSTVGNAAAQRNVIVLDENAGGEIDAVIGAAAAEHRVFLEGAHAGDGLARVENASAGALDRISVSTRERGDTAEMLQQVEDHSFATEQDARIVANDGEHLAGMGAHAVEDFGVADDFKSGLRLGTPVEPGVNFKEARDGAEAGDDEIFTRDDGAVGAQAGIDGEAGGGVAGRPGLPPGPVPAMRRCGGSSNP